MGSAMRRPPDPLKFLRALQERPFDYGFYQVLREIECRYPAQPRLGTANRPQDEPIRLGQDPSMAFAPAIFSSVQPATDGRVARLIQQFFGMFGPNGPLPLHLTEFARERLLNNRDAAMVRFIDILHHRPLTMFYRAWAQAQPTIGFDRPEADRFSAYVGSLVGMGTPAVRRRDAAGDHVRLFFAGWLSRQVRSAEGLRSILSGHFRLPVQVVEHAGHWLKLPADDLTRIGTQTSGCQLGLGTVLGARVWDRQHCIQVAFGPLTLEQFESFLPGGDALHRLVALVRHILTFEFDWDLRLVLARGAVPAARLGQHSRLGWTTWVGTHARARDATDVVLDVESIVRRLGGSPGAAAKAA